MGENTYQTRMNEQIERARAAMKEERGKEEDIPEKEIPLHDLLKETTKLKSGTNKNNFALGDRYQIRDFTVMHEAILNFILCNPGSGVMTKCAKAFGVSNTWLSTIVHSDLFQAKLRERNDAYFNSHVVPLQERLVGLAHATLDRIEDTLEDIEDPRLLIDLEDKLLHRLGYAPKTSVAPAAPVTNTQNNFYVTADLLAQARESAKKGITHVPAALPVPEEASSSSSRIQTYETDSMGEVVGHSPGVYTEQEEIG